MWTIRNGHLHFTFWSWFKGIIPPQFVLPALLWSRRSQSWYWEETLQPYPAPSPTLREGWWIQRWHPSWWRQSCWAGCLGIRFPSTSPGWAAHSILRGWWSEGMDGWQRWWLCLGQNSWHCILLLHSICESHYTKHSFSASIAWIEKSYKITKCFLLVKLFPLQTLQLYFL